MQRVPGAVVVSFLLLSRAALAGTDDFQGVVQGERPRDDRTSAGRTLTEAELQGRGPSRALSVGAALSAEPGVHLQSAGGLGQYTALSIRGATAGQLLVILDGVPLNQGAGAPLDLALLPLEGVAALTLHRGLPPLRLGADAVGGVIELESLDPQAAPVGTQVRLGGAAGSFGLRQVYGTLRQERPGLRVRASLSYQGADGDFRYLDPNPFPGVVGPVERTRRNNGFDQGAASVLLRGDRGRLRWHLLAQGLLKRQGLPGIGQVGALPSGQPGDQPTLAQGRALLSAGLAGAPVPWLRIAAQVHGLLLRSDFTFLGDAPPQRSSLLDGELGLRLAATLRVGGRLQVLVSVEPRREWVRSQDLCPAAEAGCLGVGQSGRARVASALGATLALGRLWIEGGVYALRLRSELAPLPFVLPRVTREAQQDFVAPRLSLRLKLWGDALVLRGGAGRFVRAPSLLELFGDGNGRGLFRPNLALRPETAWNLEAGLVARLTRGRLAVTLEGAGFARFVEDFIQLVADPRLRAENVGAARMLGAELELRAQLLDWLRLRLSYTFLDARDLTTVVPGRAGRLLPSRPPHSLQGRLEGGYGPARLYYELDLQSRLYLDPANLLDQPGRALHSLGLLLGPLAGMRAGLEVQNLLDLRVVDSARGPRPLSDYYDYPLPGRSYLLNFSKVF